MYKKLEILIFIIILLSLILSSCSFKEESKEIDTTKVDIIFDEFLNIYEGYENFNDVQLQTILDLKYSYIEEFNSIYDNFSKEQRARIISLFLKGFNTIDTKTQESVFTLLKSKLFISSFLKIMLKDSTEPIVINKIIESGTATKDTNIIFLFDLHFENLAIKPDKLANKINDLNADVIVLGGDIIEGKEGIEKLEEYLSNINIKDKYYILGNHEHNKLGINDLEILHDKLNGLGFIYIDNKSLILDGFNLIGVGDATTNNDKPLKAYEKLNDINSINIVVSHSPDVNYSLDSNNLLADIVLTGHTHGGQINVPFINTQSVNAKVWEERGLYKGDYIFEGNNQNYSNFTSNGLGGSEIPIRFKAKQHILLLRIKS